eukprot:jgi/Tetstr1/464112/TSEL_008917.t1
MSAHGHTVASVTVATVLERAQADFFGSRTEADLTRCFSEALERMAPFGLRSFPSPMLERVADATRSAYRVIESSHRFQPPVPVSDLLELVASRCDCDQEPYLMECDTYAPGTREAEVRLEMPGMHTPEALRHVAYVRCSWCPFDGPDNLKAARELVDKPWFCADVADPVVAWMVRRLSLAAICKAPHGEFVAEELAALESRLLVSRPTDVVRALIFDPAMAMCPVPGVLNRARFPHRVLFDENDFLCEPSDYVFVSDDGQELPVTDEYGAGWIRVQHRLSTLTYVLDPVSRAYVLDR